MQTSMQSRIRMVAVRWLGAVLISLLLLAGTPVQAVEPTGGGILESSFDVLFMRPITIASTVLGSVVFAVSYPVTRLAGGHKGAQEGLVEAPFNYAFRRKLGTW